MNLKKIVSVMAAASMMAAMAVNASAAYSYTGATPENGYTHTWSFTGGGCNDYDYTTGEFDGVTYCSITQTNGVVTNTKKLSGSNNIKHDSSTGVDGGALLVYNNKAVVYTPEKKGKLTITTNKTATDAKKVLTVSNGAKVVGTITPDDNNNSPTTTIDVDANTTYYIYTNTDSNSSNIKVKSLTFVEEVVKFSADVKCKGAITRAEDTLEGKVGTAFVATITNTGTASGTLSSINWTVTSNGDTKSTGDLSDGVTKLTLGVGTTANVALYVVDLGDKNAIATAEVK